MKDIRGCFFKEVDSAILSGDQKKKLNNSISKLVLSTLRPYELANEPFLHDLICQSMEVGARHGANGSFQFNLSKHNKLISGDGVRKSLDKLYNETVAF